MHSPERSAGLKAYIISFRLNQVLRKGTREFFKKKLFNALNLLQENAPEHAESKPQTFLLKSTQSRFMSPGEYCLQEPRMRPSSGSLAAAAPQKSRRTSREIGTISSWRLSPKSLSTDPAASAATLAR